MGTLMGKVCVITGGSRGLGLGIAKVFINEGAKIIIGSRSQTAVDDAVALLTSLGGDAAGMALDVADPEQVKRFFHFAIDTYGRLDVWINNAGVSAPYGPTLACSPSDFYQVVQTNILGVYNGSRTAMAYFLKQKSGKLINMLGAGSEKPVPYQNTYASSKMWVRGFTLALAKETEGNGVGVFAFNPGMVLTEMLTDVDVVAGYEAKLIHFPKIVRMLAKPVEIPAKKAAWIASSATDGKTGIAYSLITPWSFPLGALREMLRPKRAGEDEGLIKTRVIPPAEDFID